MTDLESNDRLSYRDRQVVHFSAGMARRAQAEERRRFLRALPSYQRWQFVYCSVLCDRERWARLLREIEA